MKMTTLGAKLRIGGAAILTVLCGIVALQNTETIEAKILFMSLTMPRAFLLFRTTAIGFTIGVLVTLFFKGRAKAPE